jgi:hypothetical protein
MRVGWSGFSAVTNSRNGIASRARFSASSRRPRHHVAISAKTSAAIDDRKLPALGNL